MESGKFGVLVKYPGFDGAMMLAKLGVLDGFDD